MVNRLTINHTNNQIQLLWQQGNNIPRYTESVIFTHPFDTKVLSRIRWYLEEYLNYPYGIEPEKASNLEHQLQEWGKELFNLVFRSNEKGRQFFQEATREGLNQCELVIASENPKVLNLPWELLYCEDYQFIAPNLAGIYRSLGSFAVRAEMKSLSQDKLNILLVIARPYGERDINFKTIAKPLLEALKPIANRVNLRVLRPPSFEQLERELNSHKGFYHIVHFDGHGNFDESSRGFQHSFGEFGQGVLVFEDSDGSPQIVTAAQIAQSLTDCNVPLFVLNACKSAQEGNGSFSSVATRLITLGAKGVVAMAYSVYAVAAKYFIGRLYEQLVMGASVDEAVAAGRRELLNKSLRPSRKGDLRLQDWFVPVLYQQEDYTPFIPISDNIADLETFLDEPDPIPLIDFPEEGQYGFIGRDYDILRLERAFRHHHFVLLQGVAGVGKTELACGFARWLKETQGRDRLYFSSFEQGRGISQVIYQVGRTVWGDKFSQLSEENQEKAVIKYLKQTSIIIIFAQLLNIKEDEKWSQLIFIIVSTTILFMIPFLLMKITPKFEIGWDRLWPKVLGYYLAHSGNDIKKAKQNLKRAILYYRREGKVLNLLVNFLWGSIFIGCLPNSDFQEALMSLVDTRNVIGFLETNLFGGISVLITPFLSIFYFIKYDLPAAWMENVLTQIELDEE